MKKSKPAPCPVCRSTDTEVTTYPARNYGVICNTVKCGLSGPWRKTRKAAMQDWAQLHFRTFKFVGLTSPENFQPEQWHAPVGGWATSNAISTMSLDDYLAGSRVWKKRAQEQCRVIEGAHKRAAKSKLHFGGKVG